MSTAELTDNLTADLLAAIDQGNDLEAYLVGRAAGCTHAELLELPALDLTHTQNDAYIAARGYGTTPAQLRDDLLAHGHNLPSYVAARSLAAAHAEILHVLAKCPNAASQGAPDDLIAHYVIALTAGATHAEVCEALAYVPLMEYALSRHYGSNHDDYMAWQRRRSGHPLPQADPRD